MGIVTCSHCERTGNCLYIRFKTAIFEVGPLLDTHDLRSPNA